MDTALLTIASGGLVALVTHLLSRNHAHRGRDFEALRDLVRVHDAIQALAPHFLALSDPDSAREQLQEVLDETADAARALHALELGHRRRIVRETSGHLRKAMASTRGHLFASFLDRHGLPGSEGPRKMLQNHKAGTAMVEVLTEATVELARLIRSAWPWCRPESRVLRGENVRELAGGAGE